MTATLKIAPAPTSAARCALASAIEAMAALDKQAADAEVTSNRLEEAVFAQIDVVEAARQAANDVQLAAVAHLADMSTPAPAKTLRQTLDALQDEETNLANLRAARDRARSVPDSMRTSRSLAQTTVDEAAARVMAEEPATRALVERYRRMAAEINSMARTLEFLGNRNALPPDLVRWRSFEASNACEASWRAAFAALATDPNATLSEFSA
ncbi:MAG: hypothetical protein P4L80_02515 [Xanthobacteraceae bacterium]|nr:hypothetical protein [Xanthobacteraceae bacterium]